jgi:alpha-tubulin suppressor-like RCC1 family protein
MRHAFYSLFTLFAACGAAGPVSQDVSTSNSSKLPTVSELSSGSNDNGQMPMVGLVWIDTSMGSDTQCNGTLITPDIVLTSMSCLQMMGFGTGGSDWFETDNGGNQLVDKLLANPNQQGVSSPGNAPDCSTFNDAALLHLVAPIANVPTTLQPAQAGSQLPADGSVPTIVEYDLGSPSLKNPQEYPKIIGTETVVSSSSNLIQVSKGTLNPHTSNDAGAPLIVGSTIYGIGTDTCATGQASGQYTAYSRIDAVSTWIANTVAAWDSVTPPASSTVASVVAGDGFACTLMSDGSVQCWGDDFYGQLGDYSGSCGLQKKSLVPVVVPGISARALSIGNGSICALLADSTVTCWGWTAAANPSGFGTPRNCVMPTPVSGLSNVVSIADGRGGMNSGPHTCALLADQTVSCWGFNAAGELGNGTTTNSATPVTVQGVNDATQIASGYDQTCALHSDGTVSCWGYDVQALDSVNTAPVAIPGVTTATSIGVGGDFACAILKDETMTCWGGAPQANTFGNGISPAPTANWIAPTVVGGLPSVTAMAVGSHTVCGLSMSNEVWCWGSNNWGTLGNGDNEDSSIPVKVANLGGPATSIALGDRSAYAQLFPSGVSSWGANESGELGNNSLTPSNTPVSVSGF